MQSADDDAISTASTISGAPSTSRPIQAGTPVVRLARSMKGRDGWMWSVNPIGHQAVRRSIHNIVRGSPGPTLPVNFSGLSPENYFKILIREGIVETVVRHTKSMLTLLRENVHAKYTATFQNTDVVEIQGLIGVLLLQGVKHDNHLASYNFSIFSFGHLRTGQRCLREGFAFCCHVCALTINRRGQCEKLRTNLPQSRKYGNLS